MQNYQANTEKIFIKSFWRGGKVKFFPRKNFGGGDPGLVREFLFPECGPEGIRAHNNI